MVEPMYGPNALKWVGSTRAVCPKSVYPTLRHPVPYIIVWMGVDGNNVLTVWIDYFRKRGRCKRSFEGHFIL